MGSLSHSAQVGPHLKLAEIRHVGNHGVGLVSAALADKPIVKAAMHVRARMLSRMPRPWDEKFYHAIRNAPGLFEMKWKADGRQWRISGYDYEGYFVMLLLFSHKQNTYTPHGWLKISKRNHIDACAGHYDIVKYTF